MTTNKSQKARRNQQWNTVMSLPKVGIKKSLRCPEKIFRDEAEYRWDAYIREMEGNDEELC